MVEICVAYVSTGASHMAPSDLDSILDVARRFNGAHDITGLLLYNGFTFVQILEGPASAVDPLMDRIRADPRHSGVIEIYREPLGARNFSDWSMMYKFARQSFGDEAAAASPGLPPILRNAIGLIAGRPS